MVKFEANLIPLEVDVWEEIERVIKTGFTDVYRVEFRYSVDVKVAVIVISCRKNGKPYSEVFTLDDSNSETLVTNLCKRFNIQWVNLKCLDFTLKPGVLPIFTVMLYPFVNDESTLNTTKSRMNPKTID